MLEKNSPINEAKNFNNFSMGEKISVPKINLRGNANNKDFTSKVSEILGIILPLEVGKITIKEEISIICTGPNEWLIISNNTVEENGSSFELENIFTNSWGNKKCVVSNLRSDDTWSKIWFYRDLKNDKKFPVQVWAIAKKK